MTTEEDLSPLCDLIAVGLKRGHLIKAGAVTEIPPALLAFAISAGWIRPSDLLTEWGCDACDHPHMSEVERRPDGTYSYLCLHNGRLPLSHAQLQTYRIDLAAVQATFASCIGARTGGIVGYASDRLFKIGYIAGSHARDGWTLGFVSDVGDPQVLATVLARLRDSFPKGPGLIATLGSRPTGEDRPEGYLFVTASRLLRLQGTSIAFAHDIASQLLFGPRAITEITGRKSNTPAVAAIRHRLIAEGKWPAGRRDQVKAIFRAWLPKTMGKQPSKSSLPRNIRAAEKADRETGPNTDAATVQKGKTQRR